MKNQNTRFREVFGYLKSQKKIWNQQDLADRLGSDKTSISLALNNRVPIPLKMVDKICDEFPFINRSWIISGEGDMLLPEDAHMAANDDTNYSMVPVMHIDSVGGMHSGNNILTPEYIERYIPMTGAREGDLAIYQSGNSMAPAIPPGALLLIREVETWREYIGYGDVFVMLLTDERRITKEIHRYADDPKNYFWCVSYNPEVADEELPKSLVRRVWKVIKVLIDKGW